MATVECEVMREGWRSEQNGPAVNIEWIMRPFRVLLCPEQDGGFSVHCLELEGIVSQGESEREALDNIEEAIAGAIASFKSAHQEIPYSDVKVDEAPDSSREYRVLVNV
jgi:predicted RNase H-like HicB family nuclease